MDLAQKALAHLTSACLCGHDIGVAPAHCFTTSLSRSSIVRDRPSYALVAQRKRQAAAVRRSAVAVYLIVY